MTVSRLRLVLWAAITAVPAAILSAFAVGAAPGAPVLVRDIATDRGPSAVPTTALEFVELEGSWWFSADDGLHGWELWRIPAGGDRAERMTDLCPGACSSMPRDLAAAADRVFFSAWDGAHGRELWSIDGTGTAELVDLEPGLGSSHPGFLTPFASRVYFVATTGATGSELWSTDGTAAGTAPVLEIEPGPRSSAPRALAVAGPVLLFLARTTEFGEELWRSDGTAAGTSQAPEICPGPATFCLDPGDSGRLAVLGERAIFFAGGDELWVSDGTPGGTERLRDDLLSNFALAFARIGDELLFPALQAPTGRELWKTDGTPEGTMLVADVQPGSTGSNAYPLQVVEDRLFFSASNVGVHLWVTDGTSEGTALAHPLAPEMPVAAFGSQLVFHADDGTRGGEPWITDGTVQGTRLLRDVNPGPDGAFDARFNLTRPVPDGDRLLFFAYSRPTGFELWESDGTEKGTRLLHDLDTQASSVPRAFDGSPAGELADFGGLLLFTAEEPAHGAELWRSDGSEAGTVLVRDLVPGPDPHSEGFLRPVGPEELTATDRRAYFAADLPLWGPVLWRTNGWASGTQPVEDPSAWPGLGPNSLVANPAAGSGADLVYRAMLNLEQSPVWRSDGTGSGTYPVTSSSPGVLVPFGDRVLFGAAGGLWETDGTIAGTLEILDFGRAGLGPRFNWSPAELPAGLVFAAYDGLVGAEPWFTDGTAARTRPIADLRPGPQGSLRAGFQAVDLAAAAGRRVVFVADDGLLGEEPWATDGRRARRLADVWPGPVGSSPTRLKSLGDVVLFAADDGVHGRELWRTDATRPGTALLVDLLPGAGSGLVETAVGATEAGVVWRGRLYFAATDGVHGVESWSTDGTAEGTAMVADLHPGPGSSSPSSFTVSGGELFFRANDGVHGFELWKIPPAP